MLIFRYICQNPTNTRLMGSYFSEKDNSIFSFLNEQDWFSLINIFIIITCLVIWVRENLNYMSRSRYQSEKSPSTSLPFPFPFPS